MNDVGDHKSLKELTVGVVISGGFGKRIGANKAALVFGGKTLLSRAVDRLKGQCTEIVVCVRDRNSLDFVPPKDIDLIADVSSDGLDGPLAGVLAALRWAETKKGIKYLLSTPVDTPFMPLDLGLMLQKKMTSEEKLSSVARSGGRIHGLSALYDVSMTKDAEALIIGERERKVQAFHNKLGSSVVAFYGAKIDPFFNINTQEDLAEANEIALHKMPFE